MIKDAQIRGSFGFCLRRHRGGILAGKLDLRIVSSTQSAVLRVGQTDVRGRLGVAQMVPSRASAPSPRNPGYWRSANDMPAPHRYSPPGILRREHIGSKGGDRFACSLRRKSPPFDQVDDITHKTGQSAEPRSSGNSLTDARMSLSKISAFLYNEQTDRGNELDACESETTQAGDEHRPTRVRRQLTTDN